MSDNDVKTNVLNHLQRIFPQLPTPLLLQVILDTIQKAVPFFDQDESMISQYCVNKLLELSSSSEESSPIKQLLSPERSGTRSEDAIHIESSTSNMGESSRGSSSSYKANLSPSHLIPSTSNKETQLVDRNDPHCMPTPADVYIPSFPKLPSTSATVRSPLSPYSHDNDKTIDIKKLHLLLKRSSTTSKIRNLFSSFGLKNADTICAKNKAHSKIDDSDSDWLLVTKNQNGGPSTGECTTKDLESFKDSSSAETLGIPHQHVILSMETSNPVSSEAVSSISAPCTAAATEETSYPVSRKRTSEAVKCISTSAAPADSMETSREDISECCPPKKAVNSISVTSTSGYMETSEHISRKETSKRCFPINSISTPAAHDSGFLEAEDLEKSSSDPSQFKYSQTFSKPTKLVDDLFISEQGAIIVSGIPNSNISTVPDGKSIQTSFFKFPENEVVSLSPPASKATITKEPSSPDATNVDDYVWIINDSPENEKSSGTSRAVSNNTQASSAAGGPTQEIWDNGNQVPSISMESSNSKQSAAIFSASNFLSQLAKRIDYEHTVTPDEHASLNIPICIADDDKNDHVSSIHEDNAEDSMDGFVKQVLEMLPDADIPTVRSLLCDVKKENPANFVSDVVMMFLEGPQIPKQKVQLMKTINQKPTVSSTQSSSRGDNVVGDDSTPSTSFIPPDTTNTNRKRKMDDISEEDPSPKKANSAVVKVKDKTEEYMNYSNSDANCEVCLMGCDIFQLGQCCDGHLTCSKCVEGQIKGFFTNKDKHIELGCQVNNCSSFLPLSEVCRIMPPLIADIIKDKLEKENLATIENLDNVVKCPDCGHIGEVAQHKEIHCVNTDCKLSFCRFCKKSWNDCNHDNCTALLSTYDKTGSDNVLESYPKYWSQIQNETDKDFICIEVKVSSEEYKTICNQFHQTVSKQIVSIIRIQNTKLWQKYALTRRHILDDFGIQKLNELHLFHGTDPQNIERICQEGFDWRLSGMHGQAYGRGSYFAVNAKYSDRYNQVLPVGTPNVLKSSHLGLFIDSHNTPDIHSDNRAAASTSQHSNLSYTETLSQIFGLQPQFMPRRHKAPGLQYMLVARVVCGRSVAGNSGLTRPPPDPSDAKNRLFNSVTDAHHRPTIFCIFESAQSYPEYLIEYISG